MTVPSCATHNNATSTADEYLKFLLGAIGSDVPRTITAGVARSAIRLALRGSGQLHRFGFEWEGNVLAIDKPFSLDFDLLSTCLEKMARAVYFHHHGGRRKLLCTLSVCPLFIQIDPQMLPELASFVEGIRMMTETDWMLKPKLGAHQEIFAFQVIEGESAVTVNMEFYARHRVAVFGVIKRPGS